MKNSYLFGEGKIGHPSKNPSPSFRDSHHTGSALGKQWVNPIFSVWHTVLMKGCLFLVVILWPQLEKSWTPVIEGFGTHNSSSKGSYRLDVMGEETDESGRWPTWWTSQSYVARPRWKCGHAVWFGVEPIFALLIEASKYFFSFLSLFLSFSLLFSFSLLLLYWKFCYYWCYSWSDEENFIRNQGLVSGSYMEILDKWCAFLFSYCGLLPCQFAPVFSAVSTLYFNVFHFVRDLCLPFKKPTK